MPQPKTTAVKATQRPIKSPSMKNEESSDLQQLREAYQFERRGARYWEHESKHYHHSRVSHDACC